jgi:hypothetical protein
MACDGCNPKDGDTLCTVSLPILCILHYKSLDRPYYFYQPDVTSYHNPDNSFFNPWTGGILTVTDPVRGLEVTSYEKGDQYCKDYYGMDAKFAEFHDGFYLPDMNGFNSGIVKAWGNWQWALAECGAWSLWGYFNHHWRGKAWIWIRNQPNGNCGDI